MAAAKLPSTMPLDGSLLVELRRLLGDASVLTAPEDLIPYSFDGTAAHQQLPGAVVFARSVDDHHQSTANGFELTIDLDSIQTAFEFRLPRR